LVNDLTAGEWNPEKMSSDYDWLAFGRLVITVKPEND
jgi:hypothetical protein